MKLQQSRGLAAAGILTASLSAVGTAIAVAPAGGTSVAAAQAAQAQLCKPGDLFVARGRVEGAASNRYLRIRLVNVGDHPCTMGLSNRAGFRDWSGQLTTGEPSTGGGTITLDQGGKARTTVHWTDPGPVPVAECDVATATLLTLRVPSLGHTWRIPQHAKVCTTPAYAPDTQPFD